MSDRPHVIIYTDGSCNGNPGPGGYASALLFEGRRREVSGGRRLTTCNRMELLAAIAGLETLTRQCRVTVHSDSQYLVNAAMKGWAARWRANGWKRNRKDFAVNTDLWARLLDLCIIHDVEFVWVRGHAGDAENERCDRLANAASKAKDLPVDEGFELPPSLTESQSLFVE